MKSGLIWINWKGVLMNNIIDFLSTKYTHAIGWTFIHSLWQGCVVLFITLIFHKFLKPSAIGKYWGALLAMGTLFTASVVTFVISTSQSKVSAITYDLTTLPIIADSFDSAQSIQITSTLEQYLPMITLIWVIGAVLYAIRLSGGFVQLYRFKKIGVSDVPNEWQDRFNALLKKSNITKCVKLLQSTKVDVPLVFGYFKPVVLIPIGMISGFSTDQVEAILLHELAHIKRHDFLFNTIQSIIEVIFYYHPVIWWLSAQIRKEREHCCDDQILSIGVDKIVYARALSNVRITSFTQNKLTMGLAKNKNDLLNRINRIIEGNDHSKTNFYSRGIPLLLLITVLTSFTWYKADKMPKEYEKEKSTAIAMSYPEDLLSLPVIIPIDSPKVEVKTKSKTSIKWVDEDGEVREITKESDGAENDWKFIDEQIDDMDLSVIIDKLDVLQELDLDLALDMDLDFDNSFVLEFLDELDSPVIHKEHLIHVKEELARAKEQLNKMHLEFNHSNEELSEEEIKILKEKMREAELVMRERLGELNEFQHKHELREEMRDSRDQLRKMRERERDAQRDALRSQRREFSTQQMEQKMNEMQKALQQREEEMREMEKSFKLYQKELEKQLREDGYLNKGEDVDNFEIREGVMKVNGKVIDSKDADKYKKLKKKYLE